MGTEFQAAELEDTAAFQVEVAVGESDGEGLSGGIQGVDAMGAEGAQEEVALLEVSAESSVAEGRVEILHGSIGALIQFLFAEGGKQDEVAVAEEIHGGLQVGAVLGAEVGQKDDEGASFLQSHDALGRFGEVAGLSGGLVVVKVVENGGHGVRTFDGFQPTLLTPKWKDADFVPLTEGDVGE